MVSVSQFKVLWSMLIVALVATAVAGVALVAVSVQASHQRRDDDQRQRDLCALIAILTDPHQAPPTTERGRQQAAAFASYSKRNCPPK